MERSSQSTPQPEGNTALRILYLGAASGTSLDRARALRRRHHTVDIVDPKALLPRRFHSGRVINKLIHEFGGMFCAPYVRRRLLRAIGGRRYDLVWVDGGDLIAPATIAALKAGTAPVVLNYNVDDPYGLRDRNQWRCYLRSVPDYDLVAVVRSDNVREAEALGAKRVLRVYRSADEISHAPCALSIEEALRWRSEVLFAGTWMPGRGAFMQRLLELGVPLSIRGNGWSEAPEWNEIKRAWRGPNAEQRDYACAVLGARIALGLLSKENRDLHTTRSLEIPALGTVLCAERTAEHLALYRDGEEAVFWSTAEECADQCRRLLGDEALRQRIAAAGQRRCRQNDTFNEPTMQRILDTALGYPSSVEMPGFMQAKGTGR